MQSGKDLDGERYISELKVQFISFIILRTDTWG